MSKIVILDEATANQIAAGEVIEHPASVVKELAENAIDAGASQIVVEIQNGGITFIRVTDNGSGIDSDDIEFAFERHATSKIRKIGDLDSLSTMGFRGEALASIASVSHLSVITKTKEAQAGTKIDIEGGRVLSVSKTGSPDGTSFTVKNLFYNTPARYKFLKKDSTEAGYVSEGIVRLALANPGISFKFIQNGKLMLHTPGNHDLLSAIYSIFGKDISKSVLPVKYESEDFELSGFIGRSEIARGNRNNQYAFLNGRYIKSPIITKALEEAYKTILMQRKFPFSVLVINTSPLNYDVNVHPQKLEVRFANEGKLFSAIYHGVKNTILPGLGIKTLEITEPKTEEKKPLLYNPERAEESNMGSKTQELPQKAQITVPPIPPISKIEKPIINLPQIEHKIPKIEPEPKQESFLNQIYPQKQEAKDEYINDLVDANIVGQAFDTYIILQNGDKLYIIDQHAAHERIRYETIKDRLAKAENFSQMMLEPIVINLGPQEYSFVMEKRDDFNKLGFDVEPFGTYTIILRSIPDFYDNNFGVKDFIEIMDRWIQIGNEKRGLSDEAIFLISCRGALKANKALSNMEIRDLIQSLNKMDNPYTCVHGRPIILALDKKEFEKRFKRIV